jgi:hypothetical protein
MNHALTHHTETSSSPHPFVNPSPLNGGTGRGKVAIVGFEEQNIRTAPYDDPDWDIWMFNMSNRLGIARDREGRFRADRWFDLHEGHAQSDLDLAWIQTCPVPIYLPESIGTNTNQVILNLEEIEGDIWTRYGRLIRMNYFASSFAYALALAIAEGYTTIGLFGVNLDWGRERVVERGNLEYWIGIAEGLGLEVILSEGHKLLTHPGLYGFEYDKERTGSIGICAELMRQLMQAKDMKGAFDGMMDARVQALNDLTRRSYQHIQQIVYQSPYGPGPNNDAS